MSESRSHKATANRIAKKLGTEYKGGQGVDIKSSRATVEVETLSTISDGLRQLRGCRGPAYIAGTNKATVEKAIEVTANTTVGVMDNQGRVVKPSTRKK